jgi:hypothetical protein
MRDMRVDQSPLMLFIGARIRIVQEKQGYIEFGNDAPHFVLGLHDLQFR